MAPSDPVRWYDASAAELAPRYESVSPDELLSWLVDFLPVAPGLVLDIGAGTGRDAAWFTEKGYKVIAVEPSGGMRREAGEHAWNQSRRATLEAR